MSHYTVAVITKTNPADTTELEQLLAPFDENLKVEPYISRTREQIIEEGKKRKECWKQKIEEETSIDKLKEFLLAPSYQWARKYLSAETDEDFHFAEACAEELDVDGNEWSTYSKNSKWDWWDIGGRWRKSLRDYNGNYHDTLRISEWDYNYINPEAIKRYSRLWEVAVEGAEPTEEEKIRLFYTPEYYLKKYGNKSNYIKSMMTFSTYALLTPDGEWLEPGRMGWWGVSGADPVDEGKWERDFTSLIDTFDKDMYITIVDCHI